MEETIYIDGLPGDKCEVDFTAEAEFYPEQKAGEFTEPFPAHYEFHSITWFRELFTMSENKIIEDAIVKVADELHDLAMKRDEEAFDYCP